MPTATILVVDGDPDCVWSIRYTLQDDGYDVVTAVGGAEALSLAQHVRPELVILEVVLPDTDGLRVCQMLRRDQRLAAVPILLLSRRNSIEDRISGLNAGADDYMAKPFDTRELKARICALLRRADRGCGLPGRASSQLSYRNLRLDLRSRRAMVDKRAVLLTPAEFDLLRYLLTHQGEVFSSEHLLQHLWHDDEAIRDNGLVRWHVMKLRAKIEPDPGRPIYVLTVPRHGYMLGESAEF